MNTSPAPVNPLQAVQPQSTAGRKQDSAAPDVPFSQVLSGEMAQNKRDSDARKVSAQKQDAAAKHETGKKADADVKPDPADSAAARADTDIAQPALATDGAAPATDSARPDTAAVVPETLLALAISPDQLKLAPTANGRAATQTADDLSANESTTPDAGKGRASKSLQAQQSLLARQLGDDAPGAQKMDATASGKAAATAFSGQLAEARQPDTLKTTVVPSDLLSNPALRVTPQTALDVPSPLHAATANRLAPSVGTTAWGQALGDKVVWMAAGAQQTASLTLNPPDMGPLHIVLNISNDQATASFFSAQPEVRQALEAAFPRLREMMDEAGIQLGQATVSADTPQHNDNPNQARRSALPFAGMNEAATSGLPATAAPVVQSGRGLIDTFA